MREILYRFLWLFFACGSTSSALSQPIPGREAEVNSLITAIEGRDRREVMQAAQYIYYSGLSDNRLAEAVNQRLLRDYRDLHEPKRVRFVPGAVVVVTHYGTFGDGIYGIWLARALASFGLPEFVGTLEQVGGHPKKGGSPADRVRKVALIERNKIEWHQRKNQLINAAVTYVADEDPELSRLIALLESSDASYQSLALEWFDASNVSNERMLAIVDRQVADYAVHADELKSKSDLKAVSLRLRILGRSQEKKFRPSLESIAKSNAHPTIKKRAQAALAGILWTDDSDREQSDTNDDNALDDRTQ